MTTKELENRLACLRDCARALFPGLGEAVAVQVSITKPTVAAVEAAEGWLGCYVKADRDRPPILYLWPTDVPADMSAPVKPSGAS